MSPAWDPSGASIPCFFLSGLKCPPADIKGGSHLPMPWTWKACSPAGKPFTERAISTPPGVWVNVALPTSLLSLSFRVAFALCAATENVESARSDADAVKVQRIFMTILREAWLAIDNNIARFAAQARLGPTSCPLRVACGVEGS